MDEATIKRLNQINRDFYLATADAFDESRGALWPGWDRLLPYLPSTLSVLDLGCGNGRFGRFLADRLGASAVSFHGIDNNSVLLQRARDSLSDLPNLVLEHRDIFAPMFGPDQRRSQNVEVSGGADSPLHLGEGQGVRFDFQRRATLVVLFGILHHIPGLEQRRDLLHSASLWLAPGGILVFTCWRFMEYERFRQRIVPWPDDLRDQVERGDYLLDWRRGNPAVRYCHYVDDAEQADLVAASGLSEIDTYRADGESNDMNRYAILAHP